MKKHILLIFLSLLFSGSNVSLANTTIIECQFSNSKYQGVVSLDSIGQGLLEFQSKNSSSGASQKYTCPLLIQDMWDHSRAISPHIKIEFFKEVCQPFNASHTDMFSRDVVLSIDLSVNRPPSAYFYWLKAHQDGDCTINTISLFDLKLNARKFKKGLWGRYPSSKKPRLRK